MLKIIYIESLFDTYTYILDLKSDEMPFCFITGPNGYGKTTILNLLNALYTGNLTMLSETPFKCLRLVFDDPYEVTVEQRRESIEEEGSDEGASFDVFLHILFKKQDSESPIYAIDWNSRDDREEKGEDFVMNGLALYFRSHPIYYIRDGRIRTPDGMPVVKEYPSRLQALLYKDSWANQEEKEAFQKRLQTFCDIIDRSQFAHKNMQIDKRYGFRFVADNEDHTVLSVERLSSGEQHILIMTFELLFLASDDSLVLIDEPEMSFHMLWQVDYLKNLRTITSLQKLQCIVCTHSPQIFNMDWNLTIDLYTQSNVNISE